LVYERRGLAFPGNARNIGIEKASSDFIAFIDVETIPQPQWLEAALNLLNSTNASGVWGSTYFCAQTAFERIVRDGFHGPQPRKTLPGSIFRREVFEEAGKFIGWVRAGEDTDWMLRLQMLKLETVNPPNALINYVGLIGATTERLFAKWYRNYSASRVLPHFFPHRIILWIAFYPLLILIAFNWNYLIADWRVDSPFYLNHVTKIVCLLPMVAYIFVRALVLPYKRGVPLGRLLPVRFFAILAVCFLADLVKLIAFSVPKFNKP